MPCAPCSRPPHRPEPRTCTRPVGPESPSRLHLRTLPWATRKRKEAPFETCVSLWTSDSAGPRGARSTPAHTEPSPFHGAAGGRRGPLALRGDAACGCEASLSATARPGESWAMVCVDEGPCACGRTHALPRPPRTGCGVHVPVSKPSRPFDWVLHAQGGTGFRGASHIKPLGPWAHHIRQMLTREGAQSAVTADRNNDQELFPCRLPKL